MKASFTVSVIAGFLFSGVAALSAKCQQSAGNPVAAACGADAANFTVTKDPAQTSPQNGPSDKALVYIVETMLDYPFVTKKVNMGLDGKWLGATDSQTYISFVADPGVHHLCAVYQGHAAGMDEEGHTLLLRLNAEAGKTYYVRYHALFLKDSPGIAMFDLVDEDEGQLLMQWTVHATSVLKKK